MVEQHLRPLPLEIVDNFTFYLRGWLRLYYSVAETMDSTNEDLVFERVLDTAYGMELSTKNMKFTHNKASTHSYAVNVPTTVFKKSIHIQKSRNKCGKRDAICYLLFVA